MQNLKKLPFLNKTTRHNITFNLEGLKLQWIRI